MKFLLYTQLTASEWDGVVYQSEDGWAFSLFAWQQMVASVWNMENHSFAVQENGKLVAVMPLHWFPMEKRLSSGGWGPGGPVIASGIIGANRQRLWHACWDYVNKIVDQFKARHLTTSITPLNCSSLTNRWGVNPLVEVGFKDTSTYSRVVNLLQSEASLNMELAKDARQKIKHARAAGYTVRRCSWKEMLDDYYRVHVETYLRTGVQPHPKGYFTGIADQPLEHHILWAGFDVNGSVVAFHNDARFGVTSFYHTGCSETTHLRSGINYLLFWEAMLGAKADGCAWYETGEAFPQSTIGKEKGLTDFKGKFGGELHRTFRGEILIPVEHLEHPVIVEPVSKYKALRNWLNASRDLSSAILGESLTGVIRRFLLRLINILRKKKNNET